jgi:hypothetical protein
MRSHEARGFGRRVGIPLAVVVVVAGAFYETQKPKEAPSTISPEQLGRIYEPAVVHIGTVALNRARQSHIPNSITKNRNGTVTVLYSTRNGNNFSQIVAVMKETNGKPNPSTTFEVVVQREEGQSTVDQVGIVKDHGPGWTSMVNLDVNSGYRKLFDQSSGQSTEGDARSTAELAEAMATDSIHGQPFQPEAPPPPVTSSEGQA